MFYDSRKDQGQCDSAAAAADSSASDRVGYTNTQRPGCYPSHESWYNRHGTVTLTQLRFQMQGTSLSLTRNSLTPLGPRSLTRTEPGPGPAHCKPGLTRRRRPGPGAPGPARLSGRLILLLLYSGIRRGLYPRAVPSESGATVTVQIGARGRHIATQRARGEIFKLC